MQLLIPKMKLNLSAITPSLIAPFFRNWLFALFLPDIMLHISQSDGRMEKG